jgi:nucleotide-binding universal stress UspA family protein
MIKDIVVNLTGGTTQHPASDYAVSVAEAFSAHIAGIAFAYEPVIPVSVLGGIPTELIDAQRAENTAVATDAMKRFDAAAKRVGLSAETRIIEASVAGAAEIFGRIARRFDLAVVGQAERDNGPAEDLMIEGALFESGRPAIVVPYIQSTGLKTGRVTACWDGSRAAARAIGDAMPLLAKAGLVELLIVSGERGKSDEIAGADMGRHLARHGLKVEVKRVPKGDIEVADVILSHVADSGADLIVMGGYGHSRLREFVLGGVTNSILSTMTVPVLMSH